LNSVELLAPLPLAPSPNEGRATTALSGENRQALFYVEIRSGWGGTYNCVKIRALKGLVLAIQS